MTPAERRVVDRARLIRKLRIQQKKLAGPKTGSERKADKASRDRTLARRQCADPKRRLRLEKNTPKWLMFYMGANMFPAKWSASHLEIIYNAEQAAQDGTGTTIAAPRGEGKTTVLRGVAVNLVARGLAKFPVLVGWKHRDAKAAIRLWLRMLRQSPELQADYPELTQPFEVAQHALGLKALTWEDTGESIGASIDSIDHLIILPDSRGAIAARSAQGDVKGLNAPLQDGTVLRPDLLLLDDAQSPDRADNAGMVESTVDTLENVFMGMAGPQKRLTTFCACTVEAEGDVSCHFLNRTGWTSLRVSRIITWPGGGRGGDWPADPQSKIRQLWEEWWRIMVDKGQKKANTYFRKHRKSMVRGMKVSWTERYEKGKDVCALDAAMWDYFDKGPSVFARAQQNYPLVRNPTVYELTPELIKSRIDQRPPLQVPPWAKIITAGTDINLYGLHSAMVAFGNDQTAGVMWYGCLDNHGKALVPKNSPEVIQKKAIYEALVKHGKDIIDSRQEITLWLIDGGYFHDVVQRYVQTIGRTLPFRVHVCRGYAGERYRPHSKGTIGKPMEQCHRTEWALGKGIAFNQHYWCEVAQRAWLGSVGSPGSSSLFRHSSGTHGEFATQICREKLIEKFEGKAGPVWVYHTQPGRHDYGDAMYMNYVAAACSGIGTSGMMRRRKKYVETRRSVNTEWRQL